MGTRARSGSIGSSITMTLNGASNLFFFFNSLLLFSPISERENVLIHTTQTHTVRQKGKQTTLTELRIRFDFFLKENKNKTKSEWPAASCYSRTIALSVRPLKPKCFSAVKAVCTESNLFSSFPFFRFPIFLYATIDTILFRKSTQSFISFYVVCLAGYGFLWKTFENSTKKEKC